jgi:hypothetical protein
MKNLLLILTLMFVTIQVSADSTQTKFQDLKEVVDTSSTFKMIYNDVKDGITALGSALKVGAEHVYTVLVRQAIVEAITFLIIGIIGLILCTKFVNHYKSDEKWHENDNPTGLGVLRVFQVILGSILFLISILTIDVIITGFVNPEYAAIKEILNILK